MITKIATCILACSLLAACQTAPTVASNNAASRRSLSQRMAGQNQTNAYAVSEPTPPAEGPEDVPVTRPIDPARNPALLPTPLLRANAASGL